MTMFLVRPASMAALGGIALLMAGLAQADVTLKLGNTNVPATSLSFSVSNQPVTDPETYMPVSPPRTTLSAGSIYLTRNFDGASPAILKRIIANETMPMAEIVITSPTNRTVWRLEEAVLNNYSSYSAEENQIVENFDVSYTRATMMVYANGASTPSDTISWAMPELVAAQSVIRGE